MDIGFIGAGEMARAMAVGISKNFPELTLGFFDPNPAALDKLRYVLPSARVCPLASEVWTNASWVVLAVKPQKLTEALAKVNLSRQRTLVISVVAGVSVQQLASALGTARVVRVMPNTPAIIGAGALVVAQNSQIAPEEMQQVVERLRGAGRVWLADEEHLDAVTGVSGSGPAFVIEFIEALVAGGVQAGLSAGLARELALQTVIGTAQLIQQSAEHPVELRDRVTSPAGTTSYGLQEWYRAGGRGIVSGAVLAAAQRARELGNQS